jgi:hypothetical protein
MPIVRLVFVVSLLTPALLCACDREKPASTAAPSATSVASVPPVPLVPPAPPSAAVSSPPADERYETVTNIEQIVFRFPYPASYLKEEPSGVRAKKVFVSHDKKATMILQGMLTDRPLAELYARDRNDIAKDHPGAKIALSALKDRSFVLSWSAGGRITYVKKWLTDDKDVVMAFFEYPESEKDAFDRIIPRVTSGFSSTP